EDEVRLKPGDRLDFLPGAELEPYVGFYEGNSVCPCGTMSAFRSRVSPRISIGRYCSIGPNVATYPGSHPLEHVTTSIFTHAPRSRLGQVFAANPRMTPLTYPFSQKSPPAIGHDVWIGRGSVILAGVRLETGAVVAANSVVTRSVGPYEIVAGNPARVVRRR